VAELAEELLEHGRVKLLLRAKTLELGHQRACVKVVAQPSDRQLIERGPGALDDPALAQFVDEGDAADIAAREQAGLLWGERHVFPGKPGRGAGNRDGGKTSVDLQEILERLQGGPLGNRHRL